MFFSVVLWWSRYCHILYGFYEWHDVYIWHRCLMKWRVSTFHSPAALTSSREGPRWRSWKGGCARAFEHLYKNARVAFTQIWIKDIVLKSKEIPASHGTWHLNVPNVTKLFILVSLQFFFFYFAMQRIKQCKRLSAP